MEIPVLREDRTAGTHGGSDTTDGIRGESGSQGRGQKTGGNGSHETTELIVRKFAGAVSRKAAIVRHAPVPQTDTGG